MIIPVFPFRIYEKIYCLNFFGDSTLKLFTNWIMDCCIQQFRFDFHQQIVRFIIMCIKCRTIKLGSVESSLTEIFATEPFSLSKSINAFLNNNLESPVLWLFFVFILFHHFFVFLLVSYPPLSWRLLIQHCVVIIKAWRAMQKSQRRDKNQHTENKKLNQNDKIMWWMY